MKQKKTRWILLAAAVLILAAVLLFKLAAQPEAPAPEAPAETAEAPAEAAEAAVAEEAVPSEAGISVTDMEGRTITLEKPAEKIVALTAAEVEILYAIGAGDALVGRGEFCNFPAECMNVPAISSGRETNLESVLALNPDLVIMGSMDQSEEQVEALEKAGAVVAVTDADTLEGVYEAIALVGTLTGHDPEAGALIESMKNTFAGLSAKVPEGAAPTVYFEVSPLEWGLWAAGANTFMDEIAQMLSMENIFSDLQGWKEVSQEQILDRNPDYIVTTTMYFGEGPTPVEEVMGRTGWDTVTAVMDNQVFNADSDAITRPGPRLAEAASALFDFVYGG